MGVRDTQIERERERKKEKWERERYRDTEEGGGERERRREGGWTETETETATNCVSKMGVHTSFLWPIVTGLFRFINIGEVCLCGSFSGVLDTQT